MGNNLTKVTGVVGMVTGGRLANGIASGYVVAEAVRAPKEIIEQPMGSIFGVPVETQSILGLSTTDKRWGMSTATIVGGSVIIASLGLYYVYTRRRIQAKDNQIEQLIAQQPLAPDEYEIDNNNLRWATIRMTVREFNELEAFTREHFDSKMKEFVCQNGTYEAMRKPCLMRCCKHLERKDKWAEKEMLVWNIRNRGKCLICQSQADESFIELDDDKYNAILGFRQRLVKVYHSASNLEKEIWKILIDRNFGNGYTEQHLENFRFG